MQLYVSKNNQQVGPFEQSRVFEMLRLGQLAPTDFGIREGEQQWKRLGELFPPPTAAGQHHQPATNNSAFQSILDWAQKTLTTQLNVEHKSTKSQIIAYAITLLIIGVIPFVAGFIISKLIPGGPLGLILMLSGGFLFVIFMIIFPIIYLVGLVTARKYALAFNSKGIIVKKNNLYEWNKLKYVNFLKFQHHGVRGQGLLPNLIAMLAVILIRKATIKDDRAISFRGVELVFENGKAVVPVNIRNLNEVWDFIEKIPAEVRLDGLLAADTGGNLQKLGLYKQSPQNSVIAPNQAAPVIPTHNALPGAPLQNSLPAAPKKSNAVWVVAGVLVAGVLLIGAVGIVAGAFIFWSSSARNNLSSTSDSGNRNSPTPAVKSGQTTTFPDSSPDKKVDFTMTAEEFYLEAGDYKKEKQALAKFEGKTVVISGRVYLFKEFDGKELFFRTSGSSLSLELNPVESAKLASVAESERVKAKCTVEKDFGVELKNCTVLERKPVVTTDETPEISISAVDFYNQVEKSSLSYETRKKNRAKYFGKVIEVSGKVRKIGGDGYFLNVGGTDWVTCYPDDDKKSPFSNLTEGQNAKFRGVDDGNTLRHCIVSK